MRGSFRWTSTLGWLVLASACGSEPIVPLGHLPDRASDAATTNPADADTDDECTERDPICGTDRVTYQNLCKTLANGAAVAHRGPC